MKVLAYTSPARGDLYPMVEILRELSRRGHDVAVRTLQAEVDHLRDLGFDARPIDARIEAIEPDDYQARTPVGALKRSIRMIGTMAPLQIQDVRTALADHQPDVVLTDAISWGAAAAAEASELPWVSCQPYPTPLPGKGVPPFGPGLAPRDNPIGRLRDAVLRPLVTGSLERVLRPAINGVRASVGVAPIAGVVDMFSAAPLTLYMTAEPFEYPRTDWPSSYRLIGPMPYDPPVAAPEWLDEIDRPVVLVATSSFFQNDGRLVAAALEALRNEDVFVLASLPADTPTSFDVPPNARVESWLPHSLLLPKAQCLVTHGGMGGTQKALAAGVPVVAVPFGRDQHEVARRVEVSGAGVRLPANRLTPARLRDAVHRAMGMKAGAERIADAFAAAGGAPAAADEVEALVGTSARPKP